MERISIANAQAFWGDSPGAPARVLKETPDLDYLTLDYLAEVSLSIMASQREKDPSRGYAGDFAEVLTSLAPYLDGKKRARIITNAGGLNPIGCARACRDSLDKIGLNTVKIAVVEGDDVLPILADEPSGNYYRNLETNEHLTAISDRLTTANAYLGARGICDALSLGVDIVVTGRVADPSLTVAPCMHHFGWSWEDYDRIAAGTIAGHLIECGTQACGGFSTDWLDLPHADDMGFPIVEMSEDGSFIVTKAANSGGRVDISTVKEQLLYEIGDPDAYLSPDATVSMLHLKLDEIGNNRVAMTGAKGRAPTNSYKVSATYQDGFKAHAMLTLFGRNVVGKGEACGKMVFDRLTREGFTYDRTLVECLGAGASVPGLSEFANDQALEIVLRLSVADSDDKKVERFTKEIASLVTSGPQGVTGYSAGRARVQPVFGYWPCLIEKTLVRTRATLCV